MIQFAVGNLWRLSVGMVMATEWYTSGVVDCHTILRHVHSAIEIGLAVLVPHACLCVAWSGDLRTTLGPLLRAFKLRESWLSCLFELLFCEVC